MLLNIVYLIALVSAASDAESSKIPTVKGQGVTYIGVLDSSYGYPVEKYLGIRYANPTVPRLQPPVPFDNKETVISQTFGPSCFQLTANHTGQSEDCLFLNVYTPSKDIRKFRDLPVMVWIYGGGFQTGTGNDYPADSLVQRSVEVGSPTIVVTLNYRLSFFGFSGIIFFSSSN